MSVDVGRGILPRQMTRRRGQVVDLRQTDRKELPARVTISFIAPLGLGSSRERPQKVPTEQEGPVVVVIVVDVHVHVHVLVLVLVLVLVQLADSFSPPRLFSVSFDTRGGRAYVGKRGQKKVDRENSRLLTQKKIFLRTRFRQGGRNKFSRTVTR